MPAKEKSPEIPLPKGWHRTLKSAILRVISLARCAMVYTRGWAANSVNQRVRLKAELDQTKQELALVREEMRIKDCRMETIPPRRRPHEPPTERWAIPELKAARGWSLAQTAKAFLLTAATIASWMGRLDEQGPDALSGLDVRFVSLCPVIGDADDDQIRIQACPYVLSIHELLFKGSFRPPAM